MNTVLEPKDQLRKPGSCGKAAPGVEIVLFDDDGNEVTGTGPDHPGELYVRSAAVFADYYKQHDKYEDDMRGDYHTVGDVAYRDDEGYLYICDRKKDMIISGGMNIYPAEIEAALEQHPNIYDAAVFGIPSEEWGESVHAVVVVHPADSLTDADVMAHAREHLASYKVPRSVSFMDELPRTGSGKILKRELRAPYWAGPNVTGRLSPDADAASWPHAASMSVPRLARTVAFTPSAVSWSRNATTPALGVPRVGQPGVGFSGIRFTCARSGRAISASSLASLRAVVHPVDERPLERQAAVLRRDPALGTRRPRRRGDSGG